METMNDLMIDIETLGIKPYSAILSIAAVEFDIETGETGSEFHKAIELSSCERAGLTIDASTVEWWAKQSEEARGAAFGGTDTVSHALYSLHRFVGDRGCIVWANSPSFDLSLLRNAYEKTELSCPWNYRNERDVRTLVSLVPHIQREVIGVAHNALDDCYSQISHCVAAWQELFR